MSSYVFCPLCQRKNDAKALRCNYCGVSLDVKQSATLTTRRVSKAPTIIIGASARCAEHLANIPQNGIALFIMDEENPVIFHDVSQLFIGRQAGGTTVQALDLTEKNGAELGVSRQHAQILCGESGFSLVDLGSTNGTWLNQRQLTPGKPYRLHSDDRILLGHLSLSVCFHSAHTIEETAFYLEDNSLRSDEEGARKEAPLHLSPDYLAGQVAPYLQAVAEVQRVSQACRGAHYQGVRINAITAEGTTPRITIKMDGAAEAISLIQDWIGSWRSAHLGGPEAVDDDTDQDPNSALDRLAYQVLADLAPHISKEEMFDYHQQLMGPLILLATGNLALVET
jgi:hypothetical protein